VPVFGPLINLSRRLTRPLVKVFLGGNFRRQQRFNEHTVRHLNELGQLLERRVRALEEALAVWSANPSGIEARLRRSLDEYDAALRQRHMLLFSALEEEIFVLQNLARNAAHRSDVEVLHRKFDERAAAMDERFEEKDRAFAALAARAGALSDLGGRVDRAIAEFRSRSDAVGSSVTRMESHIAELLTLRTSLRQAIDGGAVEKATGKEGAAAPRTVEQISEWMIDEDYRAFQAGFRGDPEEIAERMRGHVARFDGVSGPVADLGCGRGEFLDLLAEAGIGAVGVEINAADVAECVERGHTAQVGDLFEWLAARKQGSLGGIFMAQVIEHLPPPDWQRIVELAITRLEPGGKLAIETINPESLYALARAYVIDPTHVRPVHPRLLAFLARRAGFHPVEVQLQAPVPDHERATGVSLHWADDNPAGAQFAESIQEALLRLDRVTSAPQEYTLYATRPPEGDG